MSCFNTLALTRFVSVDGIRLFMQSDTRKKSGCSPLQVTNEGLKTQWPINNKTIITFSGLLKFKIKHQYVEIFSQACLEGCSYFLTGLYMFQKQPKNAIYTS